MFKGVSGMKNARKFIKEKKEEFNTINNDDINHEG